MSLLVTLGEKVELDEKRYENSRKILEIDYTCKTMNKAKKMQESGVDQEVIIEMIPDSKPIFD